MVVKNRNREKRMDEIPYEKTSSSKKHNTKPPMSEGGTGGGTSF